MVWEDNLPCKYSEELETTHGCLESYSWELTSHKPLELAVPLHCSLFKPPGKVTLSSTSSNCYIVLFCIFLSFLHRAPDHNCNNSSGDRAFSAWPGVWEETNLRWSRASSLLLCRFSGSPLCDKTLGKCVCVLLSERQERECCVTISLLLFFFFFSCNIASTVI